MLWLLKLQHDHFEAIETRIVAPCRPALPGEISGEIAPLVEGPPGLLRVELPALAAVHCSELGRVLGALQPARAVIIRAMDRLLFGF